MAYVAVTGGREAIEKANELNHYYRLKESETALTLGMIEKQMRLLIDRIMGEAGLYAPEYAALALKQAEGDPAEAVFLLRAYRSTLARNHVSRVTDTSEMRVIRRISSSFRDLPGGQVLGPTYDYTHRLLNFTLRQESSEDIQAFLEDFVQSETRERLTEVPTFRKVADLLREQGLMPEMKERRDSEPFDITRRKVILPATRSARLQMLARGETGAMTALAYSSMRGYGAVHPTIGELRVGYAEVTIAHPYGAGDPDDSLYLGEMMVTEVESINSFKQNAETGEIHFVMGYGLVLGQNELKAISMSILERSLETEGTSPTQDEEFVLTHIDSLESTGFVSHLKLPHYITFQSSLDRIRKAQNENPTSTKSTEVEDGKTEHKAAVEV
ncbi:carbon-phosphorus lyase complex subunit PhnI [Paenibacillus sepulcri]